MRIMYTGKDDKTEKKRENVFVHRRVVGEDTTKVVEVVVMMWFFLVVVFLESSRQNFCG